MSLFDAAVKEEDDVAPSSSVGSAVSGRVSMKAKDPCPGCKRVYDVDFEWSDEGELAVKVRWALPHGRGRWCRLCFTAWRTMMRGSMTLPEFEIWLPQKRGGVEDDLGGDRIA